MSNSIVTNILTNLKNENAPTITHCLKQFSKNGMGDGVMCVYKAGVETGTLKTTLKNQNVINLLIQSNKRNIAISIILSLSIGLAAGYAIGARKNQRLHADSKSISVEENR